MKKTIFTNLLLAFFSLSYTYAQVGIGTTAPDASAILELESENRGFLPPRLTTAQRDLISSPAAGLVIYNITVNCLQWWNGTGWYDACEGSGQLAQCVPEFIPPFLSAENTQVIDVLNPITNRTWMDRNLGAYNAARASGDCLAYGNLYQWGRASDGHEYRGSAIYNIVESGVGVSTFNSPGGAWDGEFIIRNTAPNNWVDPSIAGVDNLWQGVSGLNNPCPTGYRVPTEAELEAERLSWTAGNNAAGAFASPLKLAATGSRRRTNGTLRDIGTVGSYWTSTVLGNNARALNFDAGNASWSSDTRSLGNSLRCIKE